MNSNSGNVPAKSLLWFIGGFFALMGSLFAGIGILIWQNESEFKQTAMETKGTVVSVRSSVSGSGSNRSTVYRPVVRFKLPNGQSKEVESSMGTNPPRFQVGDSVDVLYNPQNTSDARLKADLEFPLLQIVFIGMGSIFVLIGGGSLVAGFYIKS